MNFINCNTKYNNQWTIEINKSVCDKEHLYATINLKSLHRAMKILTPKAFELWIYFAKNTDKVKGKQYSFALSCADFLKWSSVKETSYREAIKELKRKGYLIESGENYYKFYDDRMILTKIKRLKKKDISSIKKRYKDTLFHDIDISYFDISYHGKQ